MADTKPWGLTDFQVFFNRENAERGNSKEFQAVVDALGNYSMLQGKTVSLDSAMELLEANDKLLKACETYTESRKGARTSKGETRLDAVTRLAEYQRGMHLDELRDFKVLRQHEGKTWGQVGPIPVAEITVDGKGEIVGAAVSQRMKVELNGRVGFFTPEDEILSPDTAYERMVAQETNPTRKQALTDSKDFLLAVLRTNNDKPKAPRTTKDGKPLSKEEQEQALKEAEDKEANIHKIPLGDEKAGWHADLKNEITKRIDALDTQIQEGKLGFFDRRKAMKERNALESLSRDEGLIQSCVNVYGQLNTMKEARANVKLEQDKGRKLVSHNIATSRVAELLGIGNIVAHSEKMIVHQGDQVMTGCFMDFAEGKDIESKDYATQRAFEQVEFTPTPSMNRDMATIEQFDFLCGQGDRHAGNLFYKLSEPDENGKRNITGLQGIDNDLAFGDDNGNFSYKGQVFSRMFFIDKNLAEKVRGLDRKKLDFALGDLLSKEQIDAMEERVTMFQERLEKDMVEIEPDGWNLDKYNAADYGSDLAASGLDKAGQNYVRGLRDREADIRGGANAWAAHKFGQISGKMNLSNQAFRKSEQVQDDLYGDMHSMFEASEEKAAEYGETMRAKAAEHDKTVRMKKDETAERAERLRARAEEIRARVEREKTGQSRTDTAKQNTAKAEPPKRERVGFSDLEGKKTPRAPRKPGFTLGNHMERSEEKKKTASAGMKR